MRKQNPADIVILLINALAFITGVIYLVYGSGNIYWNIYGIYLMAVMVCNAVYALFDYKHDIKGYLYLVFILSMLLVPAFNLLVSFSPSHHSSRSIVSCSLVLLLFLAGGFMAFNNIFRKKTDVELLLFQIAINMSLNQNPEKNTDCINSNLHYLFLQVSTFHIAFYSLILFGKRAFISAFALFYVFLFLSTGLLIIKLLNRNKKFYIKIIYLLLTLFVITGCLAPIVCSCYYQRGRCKLSQCLAKNTKHFRIMKIHISEIFFSIPEYFFGIVTRDFTVKRDILFYTGNEGVDKNLRLYFDVYSSNKDGDMLPGGNSVLIRIHGGGWKSGDKGFLNNAQMNKYFASQGYVVFDVQYGLSDGEMTSSDAATRQRYGDFTINDMVRHIGIFMKYLTDNHEEFNANIDSVFISGVSAGGNLAMAWTD